MKTLILLPLFALLPFVAFPNGTLEVPKDEKERNTELSESEPIENSNDKKDCTVAAIRIYRHIMGDITIICVATAKTCDEAMDAAYACLEANALLP